MLPDTGPGSVDPIFVTSVKTAVWFKVDDYNNGDLVETVLSVCENAHVGSYRK